MPPVPVRSSESLLYIEGPTLPDPDTGWFSMPDQPLSLTFAICADIHQDIMHDGPDRLRSFTQAATEAQVDMAIQLGDFCQPTEANRPFLAIWQALEVERYNVLGNHDMDGSATREQTVAYMSMPARFYAFDIRGWHCVVLDGNDHPGLHGLPMSSAFDCPGHRQKRVLAGFCSKYACRAHCSRLFSCCRRSISPPCNQYMHCTAQYKFTHFFHVKAFFFVLLVSI